MGLFSKQGSNREYVIRHKATWPQNSVMFLIKKSGTISFSTKSPLQFGDDSMLEAALAQLECAYHLRVSYPNAEDEVMSFWSSFSSEIQAGSKIYFDWSPPLPS